MGDYVPSRNSNFTEILKLKVPYLVSVCVSLPREGWHGKFCLSRKPDVKVK